MFQGDLIFTLLNVVAHGIPYMGLIWIYGEKKALKRFSFTWKGAGIFLGVLIVLAYWKIWDAFIKAPDISPDSVNLRILSNIWAFYYVPS